MSSKAISLKARINNYAKNRSIAAQTVLQNYMFEQFLERLSLSDYREKFVMKGGMLIAAIVGLYIRSTMDLDTTLNNLPLTEDKILTAVEAICGIDLDDGVTFEPTSIKPIRQDDVYVGYCVKMNAIYDTIITPLAIDVSTGDIITPSAVEYEFTGIFDDEICIRLWGYNIETVMAEKVETILSRGVFTTRPRDYYDIYILATTQKYDKELFMKALTETAEHRGSAEAIVHANKIISLIADSDDLQEIWKKYQDKFPYAKGISYESIIEE